MDQDILSSHKFLNQQTIAVKNIITPLIQRGTYHAHLENVLASFFAVIVKNTVCSLLTKF